MRNFSFRLAMVLGASLALGACSHFPFFGNKGEPLQEFDARHGDYFPSFILSFFEDAKNFTRSHPSLGEARDGLRLIQVKPLNKHSKNINETNLSWSADGVYLSFESEEQNHRKIMLKDLSENYSRELSIIPKGTNNFLNGIIPANLHSYNAGLSWSRDSTRFAFMSNGGIGEYNIYVGAVGVKEEAVAKSPSKDGYATWSPFTNELVFVSARSGKGDLYTVDLDSQKVQRLTNSPETDIFPEWFPDGKKIIFITGPSNHHSIQIVERIPRGWSQPRTFVSSQEDMLRPTVSPDGKLVAFYKKDSNHDRWNLHVLPYQERKTYTRGEVENSLIGADVIVDLNTGPAWTPDSGKLFFVKRDALRFNPICGYDLFSGRSYTFDTKTQMNRDILISKLGVLSFRAQVGAWDRVFVALTNQGLQLQGTRSKVANIVYAKE